MKTRQIYKTVHVEYLPYINDARRKLIEEDIKNIRLLYSSGKNKTELSEQFNVCPRTIKYWIDEEYRIETIKRTNRRREKNPKSVIKTYNKFKQRYNERRKRDFIVNHNIILERKREYNKLHRKDINLSHSDYIKKRIKTDKNFHNHLKKLALNNYYKYHEEKNNKRRENYSNNKEKINERRRFLYKIKKVNKNEI